MGGFKLAFWVQGPTHPLPMRRWQHYSAAALVALLLGAGRCWLVAHPAQPDAVAKRNSLAWRQQSAATSSVRRSLIAALGTELGSNDVETAWAADADTNLLGQRLEPCTQSRDPSVTGWTRTGSCAWEPSDKGYHQICVTMSNRFLKSSAEFDSNDLSRVVKDGGHWCICAWAWASTVSRDNKAFEGLQLDCNRTNGRLRNVYRSFIDAGEGLVSPSGATYRAEAALKAVDDLCKV